MDSSKDHLAAPEISVLIPAYNEGALLGSVLDRVRASFASVGHEAYEVIVCDNNSTDDTAAVARDNGARVVFEPRDFEEHRSRDRRCSRIRIPTVIAVYRESKVGRMQDVRSPTGATAT